MINPAFLNFPEEAALLGEIVLGYGELELTFAHVSGLALNQKYAVLDACHQIRSEGARIKIAAALASEATRKHGIHTHYKAAQAALSHCLKTRNQYAHAQWGDLNAGQLVFTNAENAFRQPLKPTQWKGVNVALLKKQRDFFANTRAWLIHLELTLEAKRTGKTVAWSAPPKMHKPNLHIPAKRPGRNP